MSEVKVKNILGTELQLCCSNPMTGFFRDGYCNTNELDHGSHTVCIIATDEFLEFSKTAGNDLSTPNPDYNFQGLKSGDCWCLCALRWKEAYDAEVAPPIKAESTHEGALEFISLVELQSHRLQ